MRAGREGEDLVTICSSLATIGAVAFMFGYYYLLQPSAERQRIACLKEQTSRTIPPDNQLWIQINDRLRLENPKFDPNLIDQQTTKAFEAEEKKWKRAKVLCKAQTAR